VTIPRGWIAQFPPGPDSGEVVRLLDPVALARADSAAASVHTAVYRMAAWDTRAVRRELGDIVVEGPDGQRAALALAFPRLEVRSVLPPDTTQHVPMPARPLLPGAGLWWFPWLPIALLLLALASLGRWWYDRRAISMATVTPGESALSELDRIASLGLIDAGEPGRHVALASDVLRNFLAARLDEAPCSLTSAELATVLADGRLLPVERIAGTLRAADLVKFARSPLSEATALRIGMEVRALVHEIDAQSPAQESDDEEAA
jgi:hypothetical protein